MSGNIKPVSELGLVGGMFDPVHYGHLNIAQASLKNLQLDAVHLLPCGQPVHRQGLFAASEHRLAMLELATSAYQHITVDDRECRSNQPSYALTTLCSIRKDNPDARLYYIMGLDSFNALNTWFRWREIFSQVHLVVAARPGYELKLEPDLQAEYDKRQVDSVGTLKDFEHGKILITEYKLLDISSSLVREKIHKHESLAQLMPEPIINYIELHALYKPEDAS